MVQYSDCATNPRVAYTSNIAQISTNRQSCRIYQPQWINSNVKWTFAVYIDVFPVCTSNKSKSISNDLCSANRWQTNGNFIYSCLLIAHGDDVDFSFLFSLYSSSLSTFLHMMYIYMYILDPMEQRRTVEAIMYATCSASRISHTIDVCA